LSEPCELLPWDTEFWGARIGRVAGGGMTAARAEEVDAWARENGVRCLYFLADGEDTGAAHAAENAGYRLMDVRTELARAASPEPAEGVRPFRPSDLEALRAIARESHRQTRFYADPGFPDERCDDLYDVWITRSTEGWADAVLVAESAGRPAGYVSCHADEDEGNGSIGLIAVAEWARGAGLGATLVRAAVDWCADRALGEIRVVTQGRSVPALRLYERCGFTAASVGLWFHKWYAP
jgi:dTDP-4-amino-4,6-dideoxy-D-galactose acyltransferase